MFIVRGGGASMLILSPGSKIELGLRSSRTEFRIRLILDSVNHTLSCERLGRPSFFERNWSARRPLALQSEGDIIIQRVSVFISGIESNQSDSTSQGRVLVLNRSYFPIHITSVKRAVNLLCLDIAMGVDATYQTYSWVDLVKSPISPEKVEAFHFVQTINRVVPVPKVLVLQTFDRRPPQMIRFSRGQVFLRDQHTCQYCGKNLSKQRLNIDHVIPRTQGGKTTWENVVTSCHPCNRKKGGRTPTQAGMDLLNKPFKPTISPALRLLKKLNPSWSPFLIAS